MRFEKIARKKKTPRYRKKKTKTGKIGISARRNKRPLTESAVYRKLRQLTGDTK